ncbi:MAG: nucleic acid-binding protein contains domain-like protein [Candidatus Solibacter sp.]|nr:nucleic acid-binding protein contains domain-like protein [Candidatus Solibacter sp.]
MIGIVVDTNVLVSANLNGEGLEALVVALVLNRKVRAYVSAPILIEYKRVLSYPRLKLNSREILHFLDLLRRASIRVKPTYTIAASADEPDNRFLECAEAAAVDFLVTGNKRHFPKRWKTTEVVNARELLGLIGPSLLR